MNIFFVAAFHLREAHIIGMKLVTSANYLYIILARTSEIGQCLGRILSCGARKPEHT